jgi:hypothetical protein
LDEEAFLKAFKEASGFGNLSSQILKKKMFSLQNLFLSRKILVTFIQIILKNTFL